MNSANSTPPPAQTVALDLIALLDRAGLALHRASQHVPPNAVDAKQARTKPLGECRTLDFILETMELIYAEKRRREILPGPRLTAWQLIGWDFGPFRILGGHAIYSAVMYNCVNDADGVKLARLGKYDVAGNYLGGIRQTARYVHPETRLVLIADKITNSGKAFLEDHDLN